MGRNVSPVIVAHVLLTLNAPDDVASEYVVSRWPLNEVDANAAVAAAHVLLRRLQTADRSATEPEG